MRILFTNLQTQTFPNKRLHGSKVIGLQSKFAADFAVACTFASYKTQVLAFYQRFAISLLIISEYFCNFFTHYVIQVSDVSSSTLNSSLLLASVKAAFVERATPL